MSFFGLTYLGSQDPFVGTTPIIAFEDEELIRAFDRVSEGKEELSTSNLEAYVSVVYHCPKGVPPPTEIVEQIRAWFPEGTLPRSQFIAGILALKAHAEAASQNQSEAWSKGCEFKSGLDLRAAKVKHTRMSINPSQKYPEPLTDSQTMGWIKGERVNTIPKKSCEETKFASAMIQSGVNYF